MSILKVCLPEDKTMKQIKISAARKKENPTKYQQLHHCHKTIRNM